MKLSSQISVGHMAKIRAHTALQQNKIGFVQKKILSVRINIKCKLKTSSMLEQFSLECQTIIGFTLTTTQPD